MERCIQSTFHSFDRHDFTVLLHLDQLAHRPLLLQSVNICRKRQRVGAYVGFVCVRARMRSRACARGGAGQQAHLVASSTRDSRLLTDVIIRSKDASRTKSSGFKSLSWHPRDPKGSDSSRTVAASTVAFFFALSLLAYNALRVSYSGAAKFGARQHRRSLPSHIASCAG